MKRTRERGLLTYQIGNVYKNSWVKIVDFDLNNWVVVYCYAELIYVEDQLIHMGILSTYCFWVPKWPKSEVSKFAVWFYMEWYESTHFFR